MQTFDYLSVLLSVVVGLGMTNLLEGIGRLISQPERYRFYWVHGVWGLFVFQYLILFWWFQYNLSKIVVWRFDHFSLVICYAAVLYGLTVLLFPRSEAFDGDYRRYYYERRAWFMGLLVLVNVIDVLDTLAKGVEHFSDLGPNYVANTVSVTVLALLCARSARVWLHGCTAVLALAWQTQIIFVFYGTLGS
jgi:hypothetical protein